MQIPMAIRRLTDPIIGRIPVLILGGQVHAFEPAELNRTYLRRHVRWNRLTNVVMHSCAMSSYDGEATFGGSGSSTGYSLNKGEERVEVRTAKSIVTSGAAPAPTFAKIDFEDLEGEVLAGAASVLRPDTRMIISVHSAKSHASCASFWRAACYDIVESEDMVSMIGGRWQGDPDMACFGPGYGGRDRDGATLKAIGF